MAKMSRKPALPEVEILSRLKKFATINVSMAVTSNPMGSPQKVMVNSWEISSSSASS